MLHPAALYISNSRMSLLVFNVAPDLKLLVFQWLSYAANRLGFPGLPRTGQVTFSIHMASFFLAAPLSRSLLSIVRFILMILPRHELSRSAGHLVMPILLSLIPWTSTSSG